MITDKSRSCGPAKRRSEAQLKHRSQLTIERIRMCFRKNKNGPCTASDSERGLQRLVSTCPPFGTTLSGLAGKLVHLATAEVWPFALTRTLTPRHVGISGASRLTYRAVHSHDVNNVEAQNKQKLSPLNDTVAKRTGEPCPKRLLFVLSLTLRAKKETQPRSDGKLECQS